MKEAVFIDAGVYRVRIRAGSSHLLIIAFAGIGVVPEGERREIRWEFENALHVIPDAHVMFVKDTSLSWYNAQDGRSDLVSILRSYRTSNNITRTATIGLSMGGFAAILFGSLIDADIALAFCPQTVSNLSENSRPDQRYNDIIFDGEVCGVSDLRELDAFRCDCKLFFGSEDWLDVWHATRLADYPNVHLHMIRGADHSSLPDGIRRSVPLYELVKQLITGNVFGEIASFLKETPDVRGDTAELHALGMVSYSEGDTDSAMGYLKKAIIADPDCFFLLKDFAVVSLNLKLLDQATWGFEQCRRLKPENLWVLHALSQVYTQRGMKESAFSMLDAAMKIDLDNKYSAIYFADLLKSLGYGNLAKFSMKGR